jgi:hypothetical protein
MRPCDESSSGDFLLIDGTAQAIEDLAANVLSERDFIAWVLARTSG